MEAMVGSLHLFHEQVQTLRRTVGSSGETSVEDLDPPLRDRVARDDDLGHLIAGDNGDVTEPGGRCVLVPPGKVGRCITDEDVANVVW